VPILTRQSANITQSLYDFNTKQAAEPIRVVRLTKPTISTADVENNNFTNGMTVSAIETTSVSTTVNNGHMNSTKVGVSHNCSPPLPINDTVVATPLKYSKSGVTIETPSEKELHMLADDVEPMHIERKAYEKAISHQAITPPLMPPAPTRHTAISRVGRPKLAIVRPQRQMPTTSIVERTPSPRPFTDNKPDATAASVETTKDAVRNAVEARRTTTAANNDCKPAAEIESDSKRASTSNGRVSYLPSRSATLPRYSSAATYARNHHLNSPTQVSSSTEHSGALDENGNAVVSRAAPVTRRDPPQSSLFANSFVGRIQCSRV
jgi:hypothetical protein